MASADDDFEQPTRAPRPRASRRLVGVVTAAVVVVLAAGITAAVALTASGSTRVETNTSDVTTSTVAPTTTAAPTTTTAPTATTSPTTASVPPTTSPHVVASPPAGTPGTIPTPTTTEIPTSPLSALTWSATPASLTLKTGATATVTVAAHNGSNGVVMLPHPLTCTPRIQHDEMCEQIVQEILPGATATAQYTVDAKGVAAGSYALDVEGVFSIKVDVTKA